MRLVRNAFFAGVALLASAGFAQGMAWPTGGWQAAAPETQGIDSRALAALVEFGAQASLDSLLVARHGRLVLEAYYAPFGPDNLHTINSATKAVAGALVGIAVQQGLLPGGDALVADVYPPFAGDGSDTRRRAVTVQHLLDMTSGISWKEPLSGMPETAMQMGASPDWAKFVVARPMAHAPGTAFDYNSGNSQLLLAIVAHRAGMNAEAFARQHLFEPLGIRDWRWARDSTGAPAGGFGLALRPRDMAKIGLLFLQRGQWDGRQLVPRAWVEKVFQASVPMGDDPGPAFRYGDGFWTLPGRKAYMAVGYHGQVIMVLPDPAWWSSPRRAAMCRSMRFSIACRPLCDRPRRCRSIPRPWTYWPRACALRPSSRPSRSPPLPHRRSHRRSPAARGSSARTPWG